MAVGLTLAGLDSHASRYLGGGSLCILESGLFHFLLVLDPAGAAYKYIWRLPVPGIPGSQDWFLVDFDDVIDNGAGPAPNDRVTRV